MTEIIVPTVERPTIIQSTMTRMLIGAVVLAFGFVLPALGQTLSSTVTARGTWTADARRLWVDGDERRLQLNLRTDGDGNWSSGVNTAELEDLPDAALSGTANDTRFTWTREAGMFRFEGSFDRGRGAGTFIFAAQPSYLSSMSALGYRNLTDVEIMRLALIDVTPAYVRALRDAGYPALPLDDLVRTRIHRVSVDEIRELAALGYKALTVDDLVKFRIHKVTPAFVRALHERNYRGMLADDLVKMRIHKVSAEEIDELKTLGYSGLDIDQLVKLRIHRVTPEFIRSIHELGYDTISIDQLVKMRIHRVDARFIKDLRADGYQNLSASDVIDFAVRGPRSRRSGRPF